MSLKKSNEITVKINGDIDSFIRELENKNYEMTLEFSLDDRYFIPNSLSIDEMSTREILSKAVLVRHVDDRFPKKADRKMITFKKKQIDEFRKYIKPTSY